MTAVAAPARPARGSRPVPWSKLVWVTWRQHRMALTGAGVLFGGLALYLLIMGLKIHSAYQAVGVLPSGRVRALRGGQQAVQQLPPDRG